MGAIGWPAIENAIHAWVVAGSGLIASHVIWSYSKGPRPEPPYIAMSFQSVNAIGDAAEIRDLPNDPDDGREIRFRLRTPQVATLELQCFADEATGEFGAVARMNDTMLALDVHAIALNEAQIGIGDVGMIRLVAGRYNTLLEPRSVCEVQLHLTAELERYVGYIEHVELTVEVESIGLEQEIEISLVDPDEEEP